MKAIARTLKIKQVGEVGPVGGQLRPFVWLVRVFTRLGQGIVCAENSSDADMRVANALGTI